MKNEVQQYYCEGERLLNILRDKMLITYVVKLLNL